MISLFLDTSSSYLSSAIYKDGKLLTSVFEYLEKDMSKYALLRVKEMMDSLLLKPNDIDNIVVVNGPGSYTGLRVGVTIAKTYAWGLNKKLFSVSSLQTLATMMKDKDYIVPIIDARRDFFFAGVYDKNYNCIMEDTYISRKDLEDFLSKLEGTYAFVSTTDIKDLETIKYIPDYENLFRNLKLNEEQPHLLVPNYLKKTEAEESLNND